MKNEDMKLICLYDMEGAGLIYITPSRVAYTNHAGGDMDLNPDEEGVLIPFNMEHQELEEPLEDLIAPLFKDDPMLTPDIADEMDEIFRGDPLFKSIRVDRTRMKDSYDAWIYVEIEENEECPFYNFGKGNGVLTWNS